MIPNNENSIDLNGPNKKDSISLGTIFSSILLVLFTVIILFVLFYVCKFNEYRAFVAVLSFTIINMFILFTVILGAQSWGRDIGIPSYISVITVTVLYEIIHFAYTFIVYQEVSAVNYVLFEVIVMFIYLLIIFPIIAVGRRHNS